MSQVLGNWLSVSIQNDIIDTDRLCANGDGHFLLVGQWLRLSGSQKVELESKVFETARLRIRPRAVSEGDPVFF